MMRNARFGTPTPVLLLLAVTLSWPGAPAAAEDEAPIEADITFGPQYYADSDNPGSAKFEEYRDVPNGFVAERFLFNWAPKERWYFDLDARDLTQRDQKIGVRFGRTDVWRGTIRWSENPRLWTDRAQQLFDNQGGGVFTLEDSFQSAVQAAGANVDTTPADDIWDAGSKGRVVQLGIADGANDVFLGHQRRAGGVGFEFTPNRHWTFSVNLDRERRDGTTPQSLGFYFSQAPAEVAADYQFVTDWATGTVEYTAKKFNVGASFTASTFETGNKSLTWDNQLFLADTAIGADSANPGHGRLTFQTDNDWTRVALFGGVNLPGRTRIDASFSTIQTTQDDVFLPMTINSLLTPAALPDTSLDGEHKTTQGQVRVSSRPHKKFRWGAWAKTFELENESQSLSFADYVQTDYQFPLCGNANVCGATTNRIARRNLPFGYERTNTGFLVGYAPTGWFEGTLSYELENFKREFSAVEDSDEDILKLTLDFDAGAHVGIRTTLRYQERRADHYEAHYFEASFPIGEAYEAPLNEGMRRFYWTDRDRTGASVMFDFTPVEKVSIYAEYSLQDDDYLDPETGQDLGSSFTVMEDRDFDTVLETWDILLAGRTKDKLTSNTLGIAVSPTERFNFYADYTWEKWEYALETRYRNVTTLGPGSAGTDNPLDNWGSDAEDEYGTANLGFDLAVTKDRRWMLRLDGSWSEGTGNIETHFVPGGAASGNTTLTQFPELKTTLKLAMLALTHKVKANLDYSIRYWYESWEEENFAADFNGPYMGAPSQDTSMAQAIFLGLDFRDYTNHLLTFMMRYGF